jgi:hypothetical protein
LQPWCKACQQDYNRATLRITPARADKAAIPAGYKRCTVCKFVKTLSGFHKNRAATDGLAYKCKECTAAYDAQKPKRAARVKPESTEGLLAAPSANPAPEPAADAVAEEKPAEDAPTQPSAAYAPAVLSADVATREWRVKLRKVVVTIDEVTITASDALGVLAQAETMKIGEVVGMQLLEAGV